ncbi:MAG: hypothetical protein R3314_13925 [Longimicrobiales bacterium]|nr:hypothetical protein [Longimicrobiales bacterium]
MTFRNPRSGRLILLGLAALVASIAVACGEDPAEPAPEITPPDPVLILGDEATEDSVYTILTEAGVDVVLGPPYYQWDGTGLDSISAVIFLNGYDYGFAVADSVQAALIDFVAAGGGLMTTEWLLWNAGRGDYDDVAAIAPAVYDYDYDYGTEDYTVEMAGHPIADGLPATFAVPDSGWSYAYVVADTAAAKEAVVVITGSVSGDAVVAGRWGDGRTVHWNMAGQYDGDDIWAPEVRQLLVNIVTFISGGS